MTVWGALQTHLETKQAQLVRTSKLKKNDLEDLEIVLSVCSTEINIYSGNLLKSDKSSKYLWYLNHSVFFLFRPLAQLNSKETSALTSIAKNTGFPLCSVPSQGLLNLTGCWERQDRTPAFHISSNSKLKRLNFWSVWPKVQGLSPSIQPEPTEGRLYLRCCRMWILGH